MNYKKKQFCVNGHDTFVCGRIKNGRCKICSRNDHNKLYKNLTDEQREKERIRSKEWARQHKELYHSYYLKNQSSKIAASRTWQIEHKEERQEYLRDYHKKREQVDINFKLTNRLRHRLRQAIKNDQKSGSAVKDLGCSIDFLKQYLSTKFLPNMTWNNWGYGLDKWNIDHITPLSSFDLTDREQLLKACHYTNLQPLWQPDNFKKGGNNHVIK